MVVEWLRRWTWNPMGSFRAGSNPARSVRIFFSELYSEKVGNTNQYLCSQTPDWRIKYSQLLFLERTSRLQRLETTSTTILGNQLKNARKNQSMDEIKFHQNRNNAKGAVMAEWLRRWTWNPMATSRAGSNPARSFRYHFSEIYDVLTVG